MDNVYVSVLPELQSFQLHDDEVYHRRFFFIADIVDNEEPKNFKAASIHTTWQQAMQNKFDALKS